MTKDRIKDSDGDDYDEFPDNRQTQARVAMRTVIEINGAANNRRNLVASLTKKQLQERFLAEFSRRLREARKGERVYMRVGDLFKPADVYSLDELRAAREAAMVRDDDDDEERDPCG